MSTSRTDLTPDEVVRLSDQALERYLAQAIQRAIRVDPMQRVHGKQFYIVRGEPVFNPSIRDLQERGSSICVHSHSGSNWLEWTRRSGPEPFTPLNGPDLNIMRDGTVKGYCFADALIMADGRMDFMCLDPKAQAERQMAFLRLKPGKMKAILSIPYPNNTDENYRIQLREFADQYGLRFVEGLRWLSKAEGERELHGQANARSKKRRASTGARYCSIVVEGYPHPLIIARMPEYKVAWTKVVAPEFTKMMNYYGLKQRNIVAIEGLTYSIDPKDWWPPGTTVEPADIRDTREKLEKAFAGNAERFADFDLWGWEWTGENAGKFVLVRKHTDNKHWGGR